MQTLGEDIVLLALRADGRFSAAAKLRFALSGAELVMLAVAQRIALDGDRITVLDRSPTYESLLDAALGDICRTKHTPRAAVWVARVRRSHRDSYLIKLATERVVQPVAGKVLGIVPVTRWIVLDRARLGAARARLDGVALSDVPADIVHVALGGLVHAIGLDATLYPGRGGRPARRRLKQLAWRDPASRAVAHAVNAAAQAASASSM